MLHLLFYQQQWDFAAQSYIVLKIYIKSNQKNKDFLGYKHKNCIGYKNCACNENCIGYKNSSGHKS